MPSATVSSKTPDGNAIQLALTSIGKTKAKIASKNWRVPDPKPKDPFESKNYNLKDVVSSADGLELRARVEVFILEGPTVECDLLPGKGVNDRKVRLTIGPNPLDADGSVDDFTVSDADYAGLKTLIEVAWKPKKAS